MVMENRKVRLWEVALFIGAIAFSFQVMREYKGGRFDGTDSRYFVDGTGNVWVRNSNRLIGGNDMWLERVEFRD